MKPNTCKKFNLCRSVCDCSRNDDGETHNFDYTPDHVKSDSENNMQNNANAKCLRPGEILNQLKRFDS